jgi:hypothetical protein
MRNIFKNYKDSSPASFRIFAILVGFGISILLWNEEHCLFMSLTPFIWWISMVLIGDFIEDVWIRICRCFKEREYAWFSDVSRGISATDDSLYKNMKRRHYYRRIKLFLYGARLESWLILVWVFLIIWWFLFLVVGVSGYVCSLVDW